MFEGAVGDGRAPALSFLAEQGTYSRAVSTFPSLTPVCLSSIATGAHPDVHHIPHLVWYDRERARVVEYGSSFAALRAAGMARSILDAIINMNRLHLGADAVTVYESIEDAGLTAAAINITCYRGRTRHLPTLPGLTIPAYGPKRFFFYNLFESDPTGAPLAVFGRAQGSIDAYAAAVGRWLVTRDGFDFLVYYLPDYDFASHLHGPEGAFEALARSDAAIGALLDAAGGPEEFLERYAVVLCADHGQTHVDRHARLETPFAGLSGVLVTASNRAGMLYRLPGCRHESRELAERLEGEESAETVLFLEGEEAVARRAGEELRFAPEDAGWYTNGDESLLGYPDGLARAWGAMTNPNAGDVIVSAAPGFEFADLAGRHHAGGGSHGSLRRGDSEVPMLTIGLDAQPQSIVEIAPAVLGHFGVEPPSYARSLTRAT
jgi:Type I phosphodiesterase / nucleotide pyrophosphatase